MKQKFLGIIVAAGISLFLTSCNQTNDNNANTRANTNVAVANVNENANANANANSNRALTREDYEKNKESYSRQAKESGRTIGTGVNDGWLWVKTRFDLAAADDLRDSTINVDVSNAIVTLTGTVASAAQKTKAETVAKAVEGVKGVKNTLTVASDNANANTKATKK
ncbi:MAG TPA: BON domain-containing protein [Pyrinomonadaceae bacterium]|nr:BON domain-containing protein [Pyrinomonadaceae bacterium]